MLVLNLGAMGSGKTAALVSFVGHLNQQGREVLVLTPSTARRFDHAIQSRTGAFTDAVEFSCPMDLLETFRGHKAEIIIVDECQFMSRDQAIQLKMLSELGYKIYCYGLLTDFRGDLFPSTRELISHADTINKFYSRCEDCGASANYTIKRDHNDTQRYKVGGAETYKAVCFKHSKIWL